MIFIREKIIYKGIKIDDTLCGEFLGFRELGFQRNGA